MLEIKRRGCYEAASVKNRIYLLKNAELLAKRKEGGQKIGEGDTWALASYNCPTVLSEFFGPMSDDHVSKNEMISEIIQNGKTDFKETKVSPTRDLLKAYFISLMLGGK